MMRYLLAVALAMTAMASRADPVSALPPATTPLGAEVALPCIQGAPLATRKCLASDIAGVATATALQKSNNLSDLPSPSTALNNLAGLPHVANRAALTALAHTVYPAVVRDGFAAAGDAPPLLYTPSASACSLNAGAGDGGYQVPTSDAGCWIASLSAVTDVREWGAKCDGSTEDTTSIIAAVGGVVAAGQASVSIPNNHSCVVGTSADLNLTAIRNVSIVGAATAVGYINASNPAGPELLLNSAHSIRMGSLDALIGLRITRQGLTYPISLPVGQQQRGAITAQAAFAGTAVVVQARDVVLRDLIINGFNYAVCAHAAGVGTACDAGTSGVATPDRVVIERVVGDDNSLIWLDSCFETCTVSDDELWPFLAFGLAGTPLPISGTSNNGGNVQIALASAPATPILAGDKIVIYGVGGTVEANSATCQCRWTVLSAADSQHFTISTPWVNAWTSGGNAYLGTFWRSGTAFKFTGSGGGEMTRNLTSFGAATCLNIGAGFGPGTTVNLFCDGDTIGSTFTDPVPIGVDYNGTGWSITDGFFSSAGHSIVVNSAWTSRALQVSDSVIAGTAAPPTTAGVTDGAAVKLALGVARFSNVTFAGGGATPSIYVSDASGNLQISNSSSDGGTIRAAITYQSPSDCNKTNFNGVISCAITPVLFGTGVAGTPTYVANWQTGWCETKGGVEVSCSISLQVSALGGMSGAIEISGLPSPAFALPGILANSCAVSRWGGVNFDPGYATVQAQIADGQQVIVLGELATTALAPIALSDANLAPTFQISVQCTYHKAE